MSKLIKNASRTFPAIEHNILMIGELNDIETVVQGIESSANGNIVCFTGHGISISDYITRLFSMYASVKSEQMAKDLLSSTLKMAVHWKREWNPNAKGWKKGMYKGNYLSTLDSENEIAIQGTIRDGNLTSLKQNYIKLR
jgi:Tfp pilus assembly pilus retraction ATPase PilT